MHNLQTMSAGIEQKNVCIELYNLGILEVHLITNFCV